MENLISLYQERLNLQTATFSRIEHEDAMVAVVYKVIQTNGKELILKICERVNDYLREVYFLTQLAGKLPVPQIIQLVQPETGIQGAILMECLPGTLLKTTELKETLAYEIGRCLALIHINRLKGYGDPIQDDLNSDPKGYFTFKFLEGMEECKDHLPLELTEKCRRYFDAQVDLLKSVDGPCIVHRDFRPGNLIVHQGRLQGIIDWAGARASFAEEDLCTIEYEGWLDKPNIKNAFLKGYASIRPVPDYARLILLLSLSKAIATIGFIVKQGTWVNIHAGIYRVNRNFLEKLAL